MNRLSFLRMIDANLNRAAEGLRVVEDVARFHWNLAGFAGELKRLRHDLLSAVEEGGIGRSDLLASRDVEGDVSRGAPSAPVPSGDAATLAFRNLERAKEAARAIEEACRAAFPAIAPRVQAIRYAIYEAEKALARIPGDGTRRDSRLEGVRVCLLASEALSSSPLDGVVEKAVRAGAGMVQLREKDVPGRRLLQRALALRELTARLGAVFIVNDRPDIAVLSRADGVHVGQADLPVAEARRIVGKSLLIGVSTHSKDEARAAEREGADYIGAGPVFPTSTKDAGPLLGPARLGDICAAASVPVFAVGGITPANAREASRAGARRVAVASAVLRAPDPAAAVAAILEALEAKASQGGSGPA